MEGSKKFNGFRCLLRSEQTGTTVADTTILSHDLGQDAIWVSSTSFDCRAHRRVTVFIFAKDGLHEYAGTVKAVIGDTVEIGLYQGTVKEDRKFPRYRLRIPAYVSTLWISKQRVTLRMPIGLTTENVSGGGILLHGLANSFPAEGEFLLDINLNGQTAMPCRVVRSYRISNLLTAYGCAFIFDGEGAATGEQ